MESSSRRPAVEQVLSDTLAAVSEDVTAWASRAYRAEGQVAALRELIHDESVLEDLLTEELAGHSYEYPECPKDGLLISMLADEDPLPRHLADCALSVILPRLKAALGEGSS